MEKDKRALGEVPPEQRLAAESSGLPQVPRDAAVEHAVIPEQPRVNLELHGHALTVHTGIAYATVRVLTNEPITLQEEHIADEKVDGEIEKFDRFLNIIREELVAAEAHLVGSADSQMLATGMRLIVTDPVFTEKVKKYIRDHKVPGAYAVQEVLDKQFESIGSSKEEKFQQVFTDGMNFRDRLIRGFGGGDLASPVRRLTGPTVLASDTLSTFDSACIHDDSVVKAIILNNCGASAHPVVVAKACRIPLVARPKFKVSGSLDDPDVDCRQVMRNGDKVLVFGATGQIIINPDEETVRQNQSRMAALEAHPKDLPVETRAPKTRDGTKIILRGTMNQKIELERLVREKPAGVGLLRTEKLFPDASMLIDEDYQTEVLRKILGAFSPRTVTIRLLDLGADKENPLGAAIAEANPFLGQRGVRYLTSGSGKSVLRTHLCAILRAAVVGNARILIPMVNDASDVLEVRKQIRLAIEDLAARGGKLEFERSMEIGAMLETPAAYLMAFGLAEVSDFFSIGLSDTTQYTLAADRGNPFVEHLCSPHHPAVLRLLSMGIKATRNPDGSEKIPVSICGTFAETPKYVPMLLGLGIREFSAGSDSVPEINAQIHRFEIPSCEVLARTMKSQRDSEASHRVLERYLQDPDAAEWNPAGRK